MPLHSCPLPLLAVVAAMAFVRRLSTAEKVKLAVEETEVLTPARRQGRPRALAIGVKTGRSRVGGPEL